MHPRCHIFFKIPPSPCPRTASRGSSFWKTKVEINWHVLTPFIREQQHFWEASHRAKHVKRHQLHLTDSDLRSPPHSPGVHFWKLFTGRPAQYSGLSSPYTSLSMQPRPPLHEPSNVNPCACLLDLSQESWQVWGEWLVCPPRAQGGTPDHRPPAAQRPSHAISDQASRRKRWASNPN